MTAVLADPKSDLIPSIEALDARLRWLSAWTVHHANNVREKRDGMKVGGHQASCASMTTIMAALYFHALRPQDKVAVKPHAGPLLHAIHYMLGNQSLEQLQRFRGLGGMQSYPSRTKDRIPVDFSTGSVGLGVAVTAQCTVDPPVLAPPALPFPGADTSVSTDLAAALAAARARAKAAEVSLAAARVSAQELVANATR
jgi:pyruvate dehydrogenase complex dehydrogenase (E1) component